MASGKIEVTGRRAVLSPDHLYRYSLERDLGNPYQRRTHNVLFVMLNPSTADHEVDDPTIRRCMGFVAGWGGTQLTVGNLYAIRTPNPSDLHHTSSDVGRHNDYYLSCLAAKANTIVCAWGTHGSAWRRNEVWQLLRRYGPLYCLGVTKDGHPRHPLYISGDKLLEPFEV